MRLAGFLIGFFMLAAPLAAECSFPSLTLQEAEAVALTGNKDLQAMRQLVARAKQGKLESLSRWMPEVNLISSGYGSQWKKMTGSHSAFLSQLGITQTLFSSDRYYDVKISSLVIEQLELLLSAMTIDLLFHLRTSYYRIILDQEKIATAKRTIEIYSSLAQRMESNYAIGTSILLNVNQSKVAIANATTFYYAAVKELELDTDMLATLMGYDAGSIAISLGEREIPINSIPEIAEKVGKVERIFANGSAVGALYRAGFPASEETLMAGLFAPGEFEQWEATALCYRPDLKSKCTEVKIADQQVNKEWGHYLPEVSLEANYGGYPENMDEYPSGSFFNQNLYGAVGVKLQWLLFDSGGREYRINRARYARNAKKIEYSRGIQTAFEQVRKQLFTMKESVSNYVTADGNVKLAEQTLELGSRQLNIGTINIFDYQILVNGLVEATNFRNQARYALIAAYYGLMHASGADLICRQR